MKEDAFRIVNAALKSADPFTSTLSLLKEHCSDINNITVFSIGKAAIPMAAAASQELGSKIKTGLVVTKYKHTGNFSSKYFQVIEAAHPISDENSVLSAEKGIEIAKSLTEEDTLLVLLSGGGSALFEKSIVPFEMQGDITKKLLERGASIREINAIRKRLSLVKGGFLAAFAYPAKVITIALSDVLSNDKGVIASGITVPDTETDDFVKEAVDKYLSDIPEETKKIIYNKREIKINDGGYYFAGDINILCASAEKKAAELGYTVHSMQRDLTGEAREEAKKIISNIKNQSGKHCYVYGGETVVTIKGNGKGGRNQEMALSAAIELKDKKNIFFISVGSDGTDGPTDDAGGFADCNTYNTMTQLGISPEKELENNNSNYALGVAKSLVTTGATGTNVNDIAVVLTYNE